VDIHTEEKSVEMFAKNIMQAGQTFLEKPMETPFIPSWNRVISAMPDVLTRLAQAVEDDYLEFSERSAKKAS
jgi:glucosyl-3-phosphoglycerate synthase